MPDENKPAIVIPGTPLPEGTPPPQAEKSLLHEMLKDIKGMKVGESFVTSVSNAYVSDAVDKEIDAAKESLTLGIAEYQRLEKANKAIQPKFAGVNGEGKPVGEGFFSPEDQKRKAKIMGDITRGVKLINGFLAGETPHGEVSAWAKKSANENKEGKATPTE